MLWRATAGEVPKKHHIALRDASGALRHEECLTREGFEGAYSILYHQHRPHTQRIAPAPAGWVPKEAVAARPLAKRHYRTQSLPRAGGSMVTGRRPLLFNRDLTLSVAFPDRADDAYFSNGDADELHFVLEGAGVLRSQFGDLRYEALDYVCVPKGVLHRFIPNAGAPHHVLTIECHDLGLLKQWRNAVGQLTMDAPYCHRDFRAPTFLGPQDEGIRTLWVKRQDALHGFAYEHSPLDLVGYDGSVYPFVFPILNFQPRAGLVHLPPDWHGTFGAKGALICSFVPRSVDFHPEAIPCPYPHSSVDCDEFLFYARGNFTSRKGIAPGSVSYHPAGLPHGPHPGAYEASIGHLRTDELAVMLDTVEPLTPTPQALAVEDPAYHDSFL